LAQILAVIGLLGGLSRYDLILYKFVSAKQDAPLQTRAVEDLTAGSRQDLPLVIAAVPINERERRIALVYLKPAR
jgi:hypothetical protein